MISATFTDDVDTLELIAEVLAAGAEQRRAVALRASSELEAERRTGVDIRRGATRIVHILAEADTLERYAKAIRSQLAAAAAPPPTPAADPNVPPLPLEPTAAPAMPAMPAGWVPQVVAAAEPDADDDPSPDTDADDDEPGFVIAVDNYDLAGDPLEPADAALRPR